MKCTHIDELHNWSPDIAKLYSEFMLTHKVARAMNAVLKLDNTIILASKEDGELEILGMTVKDGKK